MRNSSIKELCFKKTWDSSFLMHCPVKVESSSVRMNSTPFFPAANFSYVLVYCKLYNTGSIFYNNDRIKIGDFKV